jgi:hypothetical protein
MGNIQLKNVSGELHDALRARAHAEGLTLRDYVLDLIRRDLALPGRTEWLREAAALEPVRGLDAAGAVRDARGDRDAELVERLDP